MKKSLRERSALVYLLVALIPYSKPNLLLTYKPRQFFWELEKASRYKKSTFQTAYSRGLKHGLIELHDNLPRISAKGLRKITPFIAQRLSSGARLMIIFDIPEDQFASRRKFRNILKMWQVEQVQRSVWITDRDYREELLEVIQELQLDNCVELHESARLYPR